jgi:preprotein translocase subunit SecE
VLFRSTNVGNVSDGFRGKTMKEPLKETIKTYIADVRQEMDKVSWPSWAEVRSSTWIVIAMSLILAMFCFGIDQILSRIVKSIL